MGVMLKVQFVRLAVLVFVASACASPYPGTPPALAPNELAWTPFRWVSERPIVYFMAEGPEHLLMENFGFRTSGLIGNALFTERYLVVIDLPGRRFGLVERQAP